MINRLAKFGIGQVVKHRIHPFRGVIFDVDPTFNNTEEWWLSIPEEARPRKDQPYYHLLAENDQNSYVAYVSEQNLLPDESGEPVGHPHTGLIFEGFDGVQNQYRLRPRVSH
jgi:heat shock protein HspQ